MASESNPDANKPKFSTVAIIGAGESGICAAVQLVKTLGCRDFAIYERHSELGGTWWANSYPGVACDVPAVFYSYSFAKNKEWSQFYPTGPELHSYFSRVCDKYNIRPHITFNTEVETAIWDDNQKLWILTCRKRAIAEWEVQLGERKSQTGKGGEVYKSEQVLETWTTSCKILFSAVGGLVEPKNIDLKGRQDFQGSVFHSAFWDHSVDLENKDVVVIGNGCSALQIIPAILPKVKSLTQFVRSAHWLLPRAHLPYISNETYAKYSRTVYKYVPGSLAAVRMLTFVGTELDFILFPLSERSAKIRAKVEAVSRRHVKRLSPERYWDILIPDFPLGCKRRVFDETYLPSLHNEKMLLTKDPISHVTANSVHTVSGKEYKADVIIMSTGYKTNEWISPLDIVGRDNEHLTDHWKKMGGPNAYNGTAISGFPNFFIIFGPNTATGHSSVILASENMVKFAIKMTGPVIRGEVSEVEIKREAEVSYSQWIQEALKKTIWKDNVCKSWYVSENGWNSTTYPFSQLHFGWRSYFPTYSDWIIKQTDYGIWKKKLRRLLVFAIFFGIGALAFLKRQYQWTPMTYLKSLRG